jgi:aminobenzoyl-glutamate utilization protein B
MMVATSGMSIGHKNAVFASKVHAYTVIDLLTKPDILKAAWTEFEERKRGIKYRSPLPPDLKPPLDQFDSF